MLSWGAEFGLAEFVRRGCLEALLPCLQVYSILNNGGYILPYSHGIWMLPVILLSLTFERENFALGSPQGDQSLLFLLHLMFTNEVHLPEALSCFVRPASVRSWPLTWMDFALFNWFFVAARKGTLDSNPSYIPVFTIVHVCSAARLDTPTMLTANQVPINFGNFHISVS